VSVAPDFLQPDLPISTRRAGSPLSEAALAHLGRQIRAGAVVWDLRPIHQVQRAPIKGAVNLGQVDWVLDDRASQRLQPPSVISKILARAGIFPGTPVILFAGSRIEAIPIAKLALRSIGVDQISVLKDDREPMARPMPAGGFKRSPLPGVLLTPGA